MVELRWIVVIGFAVVMLVVVFAYARLFKLWLQCTLSGAPVPLPIIVMMRMRRSDARLICEQRIKAKHAGIDVTPAQLERAYLQGADIQKLVDALIHAERTDQAVTWEQLLETELQPN